MKRYTFLGAEGKMKENNELLINSKNSYVN
jgi:hypothetical protein